MVFISHSLRNPEDARLAEYLGRRLIEHGFATVLADFTPGSTVIERTQDLIRQSSALLVVASGSSERQGGLPASALFELGYALGLGRKVVILKEPSLSLPTDLSLLPTVQISSHDPSFFEDVLRLLEEPEIERQPVGEILERDPRKLFHFYKEDPNAFEKVDAATFEKVIQELFRSRGIQVAVPSRAAVANYDFALVNYRESGTTLCEIKKYTTNSRISVGQIQQLMGAVYAENASRGLFISSSDYTRSAIDFANRCEPKLELWTMSELEKAVG